MLSIRCKECHKEVIGHLTQARSCGCPNMMTVQRDSVTAVDLSRVIMLQSTQNKKSKQQSLFSPQELQYQEERRKRKVRKLDFEVR